MAYIIIMSHGNLASQFLKSAEMIAGKLTNFQAVDMKLDDGIDGTRLKLKRALDKVPNHEKVLILTDLFGGTPCNVAIMTAAQNPQIISVVSGVNLGMILECAMDTNRVDLVQYLLTCGKEGVKVAKHDILDKSEDE